MKKRHTSIFYYLRILVLMIPCFLHAQQHELWHGKQAYNWCFGQGIGLNFSSGTPQPFSDVQLYSIEGSTGISDSTGELLFYSSGTSIWDRNNEFMLNGTGLLSDLSSTQFGVVTPKPGSPNIYYVFYVSMYDGLLYSEIDMTLGAGYGAVTNKNVLLNANTKTEKISAVYHANGEDIWLISHEAGNNNFVAYLITETGVSTTPVVSSTGLIYPAWDPVTDPDGQQAYDFAAGQLKFSPDGSKVASAISGTFASTNKGVQLADFNNITGEVSNSVFLNGFTGMVYGLEFSPNSRYLYATDPFFIVFGIVNGKLHQFDVDAGDGAAIQNSRTVVTDLTGTVNHFGALQLGPDGKLYACNAMNNSVHEVSYPNNAGTAAGFITGTIATGRPACLLGLPTFNQTYFESGIEHSGGGCPAPEAVSFSLLRIPGITDVTWDFGDPGSGASNTGTGIQPSHAFSAAGSYTVTAQITSNNAVQTATTTVVIIAGPDAALPNPQDLALCDDGTGNAVFDLTQFDTAILNGQDTATFSVAYFTSEANAVANTPIPTPENFQTTGQTIYVTVTSAETGCRTIIHFDLVVNPLPVVTAIEDVEYCGNFSGTAVFNLKGQDTAILNGRDPNAFAVTYFTDASGVNKINEPQSFVSSGQIIYASLTNIATGCSAMVFFDLIVTPAGQLPENLSIEGCSPFDLTVIAGDLEVGLDLSFYVTEQDALAEANVIANPQNYNVPANSATVYIVAKDAQGCMSLGELLLQSAGCVIPRGISPNDDGMNDNFDLSAFDVKHLGIFNRYGQEVYSQVNYVNQWHGQSDNGKELPTGTYYYYIERSGGEKNTGWVYINREVN